MNNEQQQMEIDYKLFADTRSSIEELLHTLQGYKSVFQGAEAEELIA